MQIGEGGRHGDTDEDTVFNTPVVYKTGQPPFGNDEEGDEANDENIVTMKMMSLVTMEDRTLWRYRTLMTMRKGSPRMSSGTYRKETPSISFQSYA